MNDQQISKTSGTVGASVPLDSSSNKPFDTRAISRQPVVNSIGISLIHCPPGKFRIGSPTSDVDANEYSEMPQADVEITKGFYLGKFEVTQQQWFTLMKTKPWSNSDKDSKKELVEGENFPAVNLAWYDAVEFCRQLSLKENRKYRLPTEAEWEYACRAQTATRYSFGDNAAQLGEYAWYGGPLRSYRGGNADKLHRIGSKRANRWGFHDMHGNVSEWCADMFSRSPPAGRDPFYRTVRSSERAYRGGSISDSAAGCRAAARTGDSPNVREMSLGFRVLMEL